MRTYNMFIICRNFITNKKKKLNAYLDQKFFVSECKQKLVSMQNVPMKKFNLHNLYIYHTCKNCGILLLKTTIYLKMR